MKKIRLLLISLLCILTAFTCCLTASAKAVEHYLEDLGMTISIPDTLNVKVKGPESDLPKANYLEATSKDNTLAITITMETSDDTKKIRSLSDQPSEVIEEIKSNYVLEGFSEGKDETYGDVMFLNFTQEEKNAAVRLSVTYLNGMAISIVSESKKDTFSNEDLLLIRESLESIRFDSVEQAKQENTKKTVKTWVIVILSILVTAGGAVLIVSLMKKKKAKSTYEPHKRTEYDVFKTPTPSAQSKQIGGYKTSTDYFDNHFDKAPVQKKKTSHPAPENKKNKPGAVTRMGYFAKNLKRELSKPKKSQNKAKKSKSKSNSKPKAVDYDIFSGK